MQGDEAMQTIEISKGEDVVTFLKTQHEQVKSGFEQVLAARGKERETAFVRLRRLMAVHETAEEEIVHPAARRVLPNGEAIIAKRLAEEKEAKTALAALEKLEVDSAEFESSFRKLNAAVLAHATSEEREEFARLGALLDPKELARMKRAAEVAESIAPTRPHPGVESATANLLVGPFASMIDRARDALSARS
jgi:hemerythrin superfamily protein